MVRRIDVTGADGVRLAAWEYADPPKGAGRSRWPTSPHMRPASYCCTA